MSADSKAVSPMRRVPGYPFFPCKICQSEGFSGKNNDGCDHTALERARAQGVNIHFTRGEHA